MRAINWHSLRPLTFAPGEAYQFDWSHEVVLLSGVTVFVKAIEHHPCISRKTRYFSKCGACRRLDGSSSR